MIITKAEFIKSAVMNSQLPIDGLKEYLFCGRSNVGKSSFINSLTNRKKLAKTSSTPGKTQTLNVYLINNKFYFIDVPGYGYSATGKTLKATFGKMIEEYVTKREEMVLAFLLVDFRHKPTEDDILMYNYLHYCNRKIIVIATKSDKVKNSERKTNKKCILDTLKINEEDLIITSSQTKEGLDLVLSRIDEINSN